MNGSERLQFDRLDLFFPGQLVPIFHMWPKLRFAEVKAQCTLQQAADCSSSTRHGRQGLYCILDATIDYEDPPPLLS